MHSTCHEAVGPARIRRRDRSRNVRVVRGARQVCTLSFRHLDDALVPAFDHLANSQLRKEAKSHTFLASSIHKRCSSPLRVSTGALNVFGL